MLSLSVTFSGDSVHPTDAFFDTGDFARYPVATIENGIFTADLSGCDLIICSAFFSESIILNIARGTFLAQTTNNPFGSSVFSGIGFLTADEEFVFYELIDQSDLTRLMVLAGVATTTFPTSGATFYAMQDGFVLGDSEVPFFLPGSGGNLSVAELESTADTAILWDISGSSTAQRAFGHRTIHIEGQGTVQQSAISVMVGEVLPEESFDHFNIFGDMTGTSRLATTAQPHLVDGTYGDLGDPFNNQFFGGTSPDYFGIEGSPAVDRFQGNEDSYFPDLVALESDDELGARTSNDKLLGYIGGGLQTVSAGGTLSATRILKNFDNDPSSFFVSTSATANKMQASLFAEDLTNADVLSITFGDFDTDLFITAPVTSGNSAFVDDENFGAIDAATAQTVDGVTALDADLYLVTAGQTFSSGFIPSGVTLCTCKFLSWGFWGGELLESGGDRERVHLATWVAGEVQSLTNLPSSGTATYNGHAIGTVDINPSGAGNVYTAVGDFAMVVNFGDPGASTFSISNFDGGAYSDDGDGLAFSNPSGANRFIGELVGDAGTALGRSGDMAGSFMAGGGDPAAEAGAHFQVTGTNYEASGIIAATSVVP